MQRITKTDMRMSDEDVNAVLRQVGWIDQDNAFYTSMNDLHAGMTSIRPVYVMLNEE